MNYVLAMLKAREWVRQCEFHEGNNILSRAKLLEYSIHMDRDGPK